MSRSRSKQNLNGDEDINDNFVRNLDQATLTVNDERWIFKAQHFVTAVHDMYGSEVEITIANEGQCMAVLVEKRLKGVNRRVTMNFWPVSGCFTLTGVKELRNGNPYQFFHKTIHNGPDIYDDHLINPNTQMNQNEDNNDEGKELVMKMTPGGSDPDTEQEEGELHIKEEKEVQVDAVEQDVDDEEPSGDGGASEMLTDVEGSRAQFVHYLTRQLYEKVVKGIRGGEGVELKFKKMHALKIIQNIMLEQYISHTSQPPNPEMSINHDYLLDMKKVASSGLRPQCRNG